MEYVTVQGEEIPALGFGTWQISGPGCARAVRDALEIGYRHIDTAQAYENEQHVGDGIQESPVERDEIFLTTKVWHKNLARQSVLRTTEQSLRRLGTDYVDLLLIHWPVDDVPLAETLNAMVDLKEEGKARNIGVSNFPPSRLREAADHSSILCNQIEYHPYLAQHEILEIARERELMVTAYSPLARGRIPRDETLQKIGSRYDKSAAQVGLRWLVQQDNVSAIPKAASHEHRVANFEIFDFELSDEEMETIAGLDRGLRIIDPSFAPDWEQ